MVHQAMALTLSLLGFVVLTLGSPAILGPPLNFPFDPIHECSIGHSSNSTVTVHLTTETHKFVVELQRLATDLTANAVHTVAVGDQLINVDLSHHQWLPGYVIGQAGSHVRMHIDTSTANLCDDLHGMVHALDGSFMVEQKDGQLYITEALGVEGSASCDTHGDDASPTIDDLNTPMRQRRATSTDIGCRIFLDADWSFYKQWQGDCDAALTIAQCEAVRWERVQVKMISALLNADSIYRKQGSLELQLPLAGTFLSATDIIDAGGAATMNAATAFGMYRTWLVSNNRGVNALRSDEVCLNHLFTHVDTLDDNGDSVIGKASVKGLCALSGNNAGYSTTLDNKRTTSDSELATIMAHELGHNLGVANHDVSTCTPVDSLMSSNLQNIKLTTTLSDCAINAINFFIAGLDGSSCFIEMPSNPCGANVNGALKCCVGNQLAQQGTKCRAVDVEACIDVAVCNGEQPECPMGLKVHVAAGAQCLLTQDDNTFTFPPSTAFTLPPTAAPLVALPPSCEDVAGSVAGVGTCVQLAAYCEHVMFSPNGIDVKIKDACPRTCGLCPFLTCTDRKTCSALSTGYCDGSQAYWSKNVCPVRCDACQTRAPVASPTPPPTEPSPAICTQRTQTIEAFTAFPGFKFQGVLDPLYFVADADECAVLCESMVHCPSFSVKTGKAPDFKLFCVFDNITLGDDWDAELANGVAGPKDGITIYNRSVDCSTPFECDDVANYRFGFTAYPGVNYKGSIGPGLFAGTIEECAKACAEDTACTSFQYKHNKGNCQLEPMDGEAARDMVGSLKESIAAKILKGETRIITFWHKVACRDSAASLSSNATAGISTGTIVMIGVVVVVMLVVGAVAVFMKRKQKSSSHEVEQEAVHGRRPTIHNGPRQPPQPPQTQRTQL